jgi:hypothetical protein
VSRTSAATAAARRARTARPGTRRRPHTGATDRFRPPKAAATAPAVPRRYSGTAPGLRRGLAGHRGVRRVWAALGALPDLPVVDRAVRGRAWIAVLGVLLMGLVALQVGMLKLNAGIGTAVVRTAALERDNSRLQLMVDRMSASDRIRGKAAKLGMVMPDVRRLRNVSAGGPQDARTVAASLAGGAFADKPAQPAPAAADTASADITPDQARAMLNDGDPSNDAQAMLNDGDPSNDSEVLAGGSDGSGG